MVSMEIPTVEVEVVRKAVGALVKWRKLHPKKSLLATIEEESMQIQDAFDDFIDTAGDFVVLVLTLKKIPPKEFSQIPHKIHLPHHPLHSFADQSLNLCLFIDDRPTKSPYKITLEAAEKKIKSQDIPVSKVLKLSKLKSDHNSFEKRLKLYDSFDMFLADKRLIPLLPKYLGKHFYKKKRKVPVPLDLRNSSNWKDQIEEACNSSLLSFGKGTCSVLKVGNCCMSNGMQRDEIVENVLAAIKGITNIVPKKWGGIRALHLKLADSVSLPIYEPSPGSRSENVGVVSEDIHGSKGGANRKSSNIKMKN